MRSIYRLGLTGGIGSGKSTVGQILAQEYGAAIIDADAISRSLTATGGAALTSIKAVFGPQAIAPDGALNRAFIRQKVFCTLDARQQLEAILHPLIHSETQRQAAQAQAHGIRLLVFDVPLLVEAWQRWKDQVDGVLVIDCEEETQIQRVMARSGLERQVVERIIAAQATRQQRKAVADWVIYNENLNLASLRAKVLSISAKLPL